MSESVIPVIDYASLSEQSARLAVDDACREWGFFQLVNHEIPAGEIVNLSRVVCETFAALAVWSFS